MNLRKKVFLTFATVIAILTLACAIPKSDLPPILDIGAKAPKTDLKMANVDGNQLSLSDIKKKNGLLVIFSCNTCPFVLGNGKKSEGWQENRYPMIRKLADKNAIGLVLVNSNAAKRNRGDGMADMKKQSKEQGYKMPYVLDKNHVFADAFGARTTPHVYLFDSKSELIYKGLIDDNVNSSAEVEKPYLKNAINAYLDNRQIDPNSTRQIGCSIKRTS